MRKQTDPTTSQNAASRLFLRFFLCYLTALPVGLLSASRGRGISLDAVGGVQLLFLLLALLGALLTVTKPYLLLLTVCKSLYDATLLYHVVTLTRSGTIGILPFNACFFLVAFAAVLFALAAAGAELFAFMQPARNFALVFSAAFGRYLIRALLLATLALTLYFLWPQIHATLGL